LHPTQCSLDFLPFFHPIKGTFNCLRMCFWSPKTPQVFPQKNVLFFLFFLPPHFYPPSAPTLDNHNTTPHKTFSRSPTGTNPFWFGGGLSPPTPCFLFPRGFYFFFFFWHPFQPPPPQHNPPTGWGGGMVTPPTPFFVFFTQPHGANTHRGFCEGGFMFLLVFFPPTPPHPPTQTPTRWGWVFGGGFAFCYFVFHPVLTQHPSGPDPQKNNPPCQPPPTWAGGLSNFRLGFFFIPPPPTPTKHLIILHQPPPFVGPSFFLPCYFIHPVWHKKKQNPNHTG